MRRRRAALALGVLLGALAAGCADAPLPGGWQKPGTAVERQQRDAYECQRHAVLTARGTAVPRQALYDECMRSRGYQREE